MLPSFEIQRFSRLESCYVAILYCFRLDVSSDFGGPIEEKVSDLGGLEGLEGLEMHGFSRLEDMSDVIRRNSHFGGPLEEKV